MIKNDIDWYYPESINQAVKIFTQNPYVIPHSGGTGILRIKSHRINGLVDLSNIDALSSFAEKQNSIELGAMLTFSDVCDNISNDRFILNQSLSIAASTLLRNRITIGGSIGDAPPWSDLLGPLILNESIAVVRGKNEGKFSITEILSKRDFLDKSLITKIIVPKKYEYYAFYRAVKVNFDYASFTISIGANTNSHAFTDLDIIVYGTKQGYNQLTETCNQLINKNFDKSMVYNLIENESIDLIGDGKGSPAYLKHLLKVNIYRKLNELLNL